MRFNQLVKVSSRSIVSSALHGRLRGARRTGKLEDCEGTWGKSKRATSLGHRKIDLLMKRNDSLLILLGVHCLRGTRNHICFNFLT